MSSDAPRFLVVARPGVAVAAFLLLSRALSAVSWTWASPIPLLVVAHGPGSISSLPPFSLLALLLPPLWAGDVRVVVVVVTVLAAKHVVSLRPWVAFLHSF